MKIICLLMVSMMVSSCSILSGIGQVGQKVAVVRDKVGGSISGVLNPILGYTEDGRVKKIEEEKKLDEYHRLKAIEKNRIAEERFASRMEYLRSEKRAAEWRARNPQKRYNPSSVAYKAIGAVLFAGAAESIRSKNEQRKSALYSDSNKRLFTSGKSNYTKGNVIAAARIKWSSLGQNLTQKSGRTTGSLNLPVRVRAAIKENGSHTIKAKVTLKAKLINYCENLGCQRRNVEVTTKEEIVSFSLKGYKMAEKNIYFDLIAKEDIKGFLSNRGKTINNLKNDVRVTIKILDTK